MEIASAFDHRLKGPAGLKILYTMYYMYYIVMMFSRRVNVVFRVRLVCSAYVILYSSRPYTTCSCAPYRYIVMTSLINAQRVPGGWWRDR